MQQKIDFLWEQLSPDPPCCQESYTPTQILSMQHQLDTLSQQLSASTPSEKKFKSAGNIFHDTTKSSNSVPDSLTQTASTFNQNVMSPNADKHDTSNYVSKAASKPSELNRTFAPLHEGNNNYEDVYSSGDKDIKHKKAHILTASWADTVKQSLPSIIAKHKHIFMDHVFGKGNIVDGKEDRPNH